MKGLVFDAFDTLFFREARPMESIGAKPLAGRFPPPPRTLAGAVRGLVGEALDVDWPAYRRGDASQAKIEQVIGKAKEAGLGQLKLNGPYPILDGKRLYPAPLSLLGKPNAVSDFPHSNHFPNGEGVSSESLHEYVRLLPGEPVNCDLGRIRLPIKEKPTPGAKPLENVWLTAEDMNLVLSGKSPKEPINAKQLFAAEPRLGIALDTARRSVEEGLLYQTVHARPENAVCIGIDVEGMPDTVTSGVVRLGGEGRFARIDLGAVAPKLQPTQPDCWKGVMLILLTPGRFDEGQWHPPMFIKAEKDDATVWRGIIEGIELTIIASVIGKPVREGGWDLANHQSRPTQALIPAGTVFFCTVQGEPAEAVKRLQGRKIGYDTELGRGELAVGFWEGIEP